MPRRILSRCSPSRSTTINRARSHLPGYLIYNNAAGVMAEMLLGRSGHPGAENIDREN